MTGPAPGLEESGDKAGGEPGRRAWASGASGGGGEWGSDWGLRAWAAGRGGSLERVWDELAGCRTCEERHCCSEQRRWTLAAVRHRSAGVVREEAVDEAAHLPRARRDQSAVRTRAKPRARSRAGEHHGACCEPMRSGLSGKGEHFPLQTLSKSRTCRPQLLPAASAADLLEFLIDEALDFARMLMMVGTATLSSLQLDVVWTLHNSY